MKMGEAMKKSFIIATILLIGLLTVVSATAIVNDKGILVHGIREPQVVQPGTPVIFNVYTSAIDGPNARNVKVKAYILELGLQAVGDGPFNVGASGHRSRLYLDLPEYIEPGCYVVRISVSNDDTRRTKHRWICF